MDMDSRYNAKRTIPDMIRAANETNDILESTYYENQMACMFASLIMFLGTIVSFVVGYLILHRDIRHVVIDSGMFLVLGILFEVFLRVRIDATLTSYIISVLYSIWFIFILSRLYHIIGPAVWTISCIQMVFAMSRIKKHMAVIIGLVTIVSSIYVLFHSSHYQYQMSYYYFIPQAVLLIILAIVLSVAHKISSNRYFKINNQLKVVTDQKNDITALYEEITAAEEDMRHQNDQLINYMAEIKKNEEKLYHLAYFDILTGLPNRKMFGEQLELITEQSKQKNTVFYVVFIDVDSFKKINDTLGHHMGDMFIECAANTIKKSLKESDLAGRIGGDEFALIISRELSRDEVFREVEAIKNIFTMPFKIDNYEIRVTASFGISVFPDDGVNSTEILKSADMAMYKAKEVGKNNVQFFRKNMQDEMIQKTKIENRLINALEKEELFLVYQPQYYIDSGKIRGFEALVRWDSPELGKVSPMQFIPIAEETGIIDVLGKWVLKSACYMFKKLQEQYGLNALISVNISAVQIMSDGFIQDVKDILVDTGLKPEYLELEVTESVFIESLNHSVELLKELKKLGVRIALDDFGTGYSSLSYLRLLPIDTLKIDKSFLEDLAKDDSKVKIIGSIISLGHDLGFTVVAEGVEDNHQLQYLKNYSCDYVQGFLYSIPLEEAELRKLLKV
jgi:diguanylate cyclase (GGDEF)-like protein